MITAVMVTDGIYLKAKIFFTPSKELVHGPEDASGMGHAGNLGYVAMVFAQNHHRHALPSEGTLLAAIVNFLLSITSGMTTLIFQQVSFDGFPTKLSSKAARTLETMEDYGVQPR